LWPRCMRIEKAQFMNRQAWDSESEVEGGDMVRLNLLTYMKGAKTSRGGKGNSRAAC